jgi:hypothetical protein
MDPGLGTLVTLPVELRYLIWEYISPSSGPFLATDFYQDLSILRILQASRKLREEILSYLYDGLILTFVIAPGLSHQDFDILVHDQHGSRALIWDRGDILDGLTAGSDRASLFERIGAIRVEIIAPRRDDPGELVQMWNKNVLLVDSLSSDACLLPFLEICAVENDSRQWTTEGMLHQSVAPPDPPQDGVNSDLELLLMPFRRLRKARGIQIQIPKQARAKAVTMMVEEIEACVISDKTFGTYLNDTDIMDDEMVASYEDAQTLWFDYLLDDMEGPCAAMVRLARFASWSERYEREMYFRATGEGEGRIGAAVGMLSERQLRDIESALEERYRAMRAWNPKSLQHFSGDLESDDYFDRKRTMDWWLVGTWWCSPLCKRGIPRKSSQDYQNMVERYKDACTRPLMYYGTERAVPGFLWRHVLY